jgi:hypothetical protein
MRRKRDGSRERRGEIRFLKFPLLKGAEEFEGRSSHSSQWDFDYTGGNMNGNLNPLKEKRVAVVGPAGGIAELDLVQDSWTKTMHKPRR